jgi:hypothetical protein
MNRLETCTCTYMLIEVSYDKLLISLIGTTLTMPSKSSPKSLSALIVTYLGSYALIMFKTKLPTTSLTKIILSPYIHHTVFETLINQTLTLFLFAVVPVYKSLKLVLLPSFVLRSFHLVSWTHKIFTCLLVVVSSFN